MADKVGIAALSFGHVHARGYADQIQAHPKAEVVAIWDEEPERGRQEAAERNIPFYESLDEVLALPNVQGVSCNAKTNWHERVLTAAARAGKHIFTEKALTIDTEEADRLVPVIRGAGVKFMISLPHRSRPDVLFAKEQVEKGLLGDITMMRIRLAHQAALDGWFNPGENHSGSAWFGDEEAAGGGALFDLGCHSVDLIRWFLGEPARVTALNNNFSGRYPIDDNMAAVVEFRNRAIAMIDVSWVQRGGPNSIELYGTKGYLTIGMSPGPNIWMYSQQLEADGVPGLVAPTLLPSPTPLPINQWLNALAGEDDMRITLDDAYRLTELMTAIYDSARSGKTYEFQRG